MRKINVSCVQIGNEATNNVKGKKSQEGDGFSQLLEESIEKLPISKKGDKDQSKTQTILPFILGLDLDHSQANALPIMVDMEKMDGQKAADLVPLESKEGILDSLYPPGAPIDREMLSFEVVKNGTEMASVSQTEGKLVEDVQYFTKASEIGRPDRVLEKAEIPNIKDEPFNTEIKRELKDLIGSDRVLPSEKKPVQWEKKSDLMDVSKGLNNEQYRLEEMSPLKAMDTKGTMEVQNNGLKDINLSSVNDSIIRLLETTTEGKSAVMKVKLYPEDLGTVDVILKMEEGRITARLTVENEQVKQLFLSKASELNDNLVKQNIPIDKVEIDLSFNSDPNTNGGFKGNDHFNGGQNSHLAKEFVEVNKAIEREEIVIGRESISILA